MSAKILRPVRDRARKGWPLAGQCWPPVIAVGVGHYGVAVVDELSERFGNLLAGSYDCVDRIVLNAYFSLGHNPGGFRVWWRRLHGDSDELLDNARLMRMAGRFSAGCARWPRLAGSRSSTASMASANTSGGIDLNKPRVRATLAAVLALTAAPGGFTVQDLTTKIHTMPDRPPTPPAKPHTTSASCAAKNSSSNPAGPGATTCPHNQPGSPPPCSPCASRSSDPSSPASEAPGWDANPPPGPQSTATTKRSASTCRPCSMTSASPREPPQHRQLFVDRGPVSAYFKPLRQLRDIDAAT